ncbi:hypothetical protein C8R44DRAFT_878803 [Mycena epipterygia]|nr:hypothetical protein C8R44DRAFT_878803 [Mycena epipterygia]
MHNFSMADLAMCNPVSSLPVLRPICIPLLCTPQYFPDPGHKDKDKHSAMQSRFFYGVLVGHKVGVVTSWETLKEMLRGVPGARYIMAATWVRLIELWNQ